jgi:hypothetical protein
MLGWLLLAAELGRWDRCGRRPQLWWRDDDAQAATPALLRLIDETAADAVPMALAVIPEGLCPSLAAHLNSRPRISVMQHGADHRDCGAFERPSQFSGDATPDQVAARLRRGWALLEGFEHRLAVYVPPWNDLKPNVVQGVEAAGLRGVSGWAGWAGRRRVDAHLDLLRWRPAPRFVGRARFLRRLRRALAARRIAQRWDQPIGLLTHHLNHDDAAWAFLKALLAFRPLRRSAQWRAADELFDLEPAAGQAQP